VRSCFGAACPCRPRALACPVAITMIYVSEWLFSCVRPSEWVTSWDPSLHRVPPTIEVCPGKPISQSGAHELPGVPNLVVVPSPVSSTMNRAKAVAFDSTTVRGVLDRRLEVMILGDDITPKPK
jgi:hypothetical protein